MENKENVLNSPITIYTPVRARQEPDAQPVIYLPDVKKDKLLRKTAKNRRNGLVLFNSGSLSHFAPAGQPGALH